MRVLAIDTSTELGSVAVVADGELRSELSARVRAKHGETLLPLVEQALSLASLASGDLELLAVGLGPGSFTGTRIGVATAKGLAIALDLPLVGVVSLTAMARACPGALIAPIVDAHKGEVYVALHDRAGERLAPLHAAPEAAARALRGAAGETPIVLCGSGVRRYPTMLEALAPYELAPAVFDAPRAAVIADEAATRFTSRGPDDRAALEPLYVRPSDAVLPGADAP